MTELSFFASCWQQNSIFFFFAFTNTMVIDGFIDNSSNQGSKLKLLSASEEIKLEKYVVFIVESIYTSIKWGLIDA